MQVATLLSQLTEGVFSAKRLNAVAAQKNGEDLLLHMVREPFFISLGKKIPSVRVRIVYVNKSFGSKSRASAIFASVDNFVDLRRRTKVEYACRVIPTFFASSVAVRPCRFRSFSIFSMSIFIFHLNKSLGSKPNAQANLSTFQIVGLDNK